MKKEIQKETKKTGKKKIILIGLISALALLIITIAIVLTTINNNKKQDDNKKDNVIENKQEGVIGDKEVEGLKLTKTSLIYKNGKSTLITTVTNNNDEPYYLEEFHIIVKDKNENDIINYQDEEGNTVNYLIGYAGVEIQPNESVPIETAIDFDISSAAYTVSYEIVK